MKPQDAPQNTPKPLPEFQTILQTYREDMLKQMRLNPKGFTAQVCTEVFDTTFRQAYLLGVGQAYAQGNITRLEVATSALQGLLSSGYFPEHGDLPSEAVRLADRLIEELSKPREQ